MLPTIFGWIDETMNESDEVWMLLRIKYVMSKIVKNIYSIKTNNCSYLDFTDGVRLDKQKDEWYWCSMKVSASKMCNESNHKNIAFNFKNCSFLVVTYNVQFHYSTFQQYQPLEADSLLYYTTRIFGKLELCW